MFYVYILKCRDDSYYVGHTDNLEKRIEEHRQGVGNGYTSSRLPVALVYSEAFSQRSYALYAERKLKRWTRKKKEVVIRYGWQALRGFKNKKYE